VVRREGASVLLEFKAINASFSESYGDSLASLESIENPDNSIKKPESRTCLTYEITTTENLSLATGEKLREMRGFLGITPDADWQEGDKSVGGMSCYENESRYYISTQLLKSQFDNLNEAARLGHLPTQILVGVKHKYLNSITEFTFEWDNTDKRNHLSVVSVEFNGLLAAIRLDKSGNQSHDNFLTPIRLQASLLTQLAQKVNAKISWLITVVAILSTLVVVFK
jgi:hypothetical protein